MFVSEENRPTRRRRPAAIPEDTWGGGRYEA
jgi:hypothetical protein